MPNIDLKNFSDNLICRDGIWFSESESSFSYPKEAHEILFQIEEKSYWFIHRNNCIIQAVKRYPPHGVFFELGGGNGYVSKYIQDHGYDVVLMEPSISGIENARRRGVVNLVCSTVERAQLNGKSVPAIGIFDVLEHMPDDEHFLRNIKEILVRNGRLYITVPAYNFLWSTEDVFAGHFRRYTLARVSALLKKAGFDSEYATYFFSPLAVPLFLLRRIPYAIGVRKAVTVKRAKSELILDEGLVRSVLDIFLNRELTKIKSGRRIAWGSSCLVVARSG